MTDLLEFLECENEIEETKHHDFEKVKDCLSKYKLEFRISGNKLYFNIRYVEFTIIHEYGTTYTLIVSDKNYGRYARTTGCLEAGFIFLLDTEIVSYIESYFPGLDEGISYKRLWKPHKNKTGHWSKDE